MAAGRNGLPMWVVVRTKARFGGIGDGFNGCGIFLEGTEISRRRSWGICTQARRLFEGGIAAMIVVSDLGRGRGAGSG